MKDLVLEGKFVRMVEITPQYFNYVIEWRNDPEKNKFLNCPEKLTLEKESKWYNEIYLKDKNQGFLICINKSDNVPFETYGWTDLDIKNKRCKLARLLLGNDKYGRSPGYLEILFLISDYLYQYVDVMYAHVSPFNTSALNTNKAVGFIQSPDNAVQYPDDLYVQGDTSRPQLEFYRTKEMYLKTKEAFYKKYRIFN